MVIFRYIASCVFIYTVLFVSPADALTLCSGAFVDGGKIPSVHGYGNANTSPALNWAEIPPGTQSFVLLVDDLDASGWAHWVMYNMPQDLVALKEGQSYSRELGRQTRQGMNGYGKIGYGGPWPPSGTHRYRFRLLALDALLELQGDVTLQQVLDAAAPHVLAEATLVGRYSK